MLFLVMFLAAVFDGSHCVSAADSPPARVSEDPLYIKAYTMAMKGRHRESEPLVRSVLAKYPGNVEAMLLLIDVLLNQNKFSAALRFLDKLNIEEFDPPEQHHIRSSRIGCYFRVGRIGEGNAELKQLMQSKPIPEQGASYHFAGWALVSHGNKNKALDFLNWAYTGKESVSDKTSILALRAGINASLQRKEIAIKDLETVRKLVSHDDADRLLQIANCFFLVKAYPEAIEYYNLAIPRYKGESLTVAYLNRIDAYLNLGKIKEAEKDIDTVVAKLPNDVGAARRLSSYCMRLGKLAESVKLLDHVCQLSTDPEIALHSKGCSLSLQGRHHDALRVATEAVRRFPNSAEMTLLRAQSLFHLSRLEECVEECTRVLKKKPDELHALIMRSSCNVQLKNFKMAAKDFERRRQIDPTDRAVLVHLLDCYERTGNDPGLQEIASEFVDALPSMNNPAEIEMGARQLEKSKLTANAAIAAYERALAVRKSTGAEPPSQKELATLTELYVQQGKTRKALELLKAANETSPGRELQLQLVRLYMKDGQNSEALKIVDKLLGAGCLSSERRYLLNSKASLLRRMKRFDEATIIELEISRMR